VRYGWSRIERACRLAPRIEAEPALTIRENRIRGIRVSCPEDAEEGCRGFILVVTVKPVDDGAKFLPVEVPAQGFAIDAGERRSVLIPVDEERLHRQLAGGSRSDVARKVRVRLSMEAAGKAEVKRTKTTLLVSAPARDKKHEPKKEKPEQNRGAPANPTPSNPQRQGGGSTPKPKPKPEPTATADAPPTSSDPLPPQEARCRRRRPRWRPRHEGHRHSRCRSPEARAIGRSTAARIDSSVPTSMRWLRARVTAV
jgi:hypothetical protein